MPLEYLTDLPVDHQSLDAKVINNLGPDFDTKKSAKLTLLLDTIISTCDRLNQNMRVARFMDDNFEEMEVLLQKCWKDRKFADVRRLSKLQDLSKSKSKSKQSPEFRIGNISAIKQACQMAWNQPYHGNIHKLLFDNIQRMHRDTPYSTFASIVQSSGTGKSRMVHELAKLVFTLPFNIRRDVENSGLAYPPPDNQVRDYLLANVTDINGAYEIAKTSIFLFFAHTFARAHSILVKLLNEDKKSPAEIATCWHDYLQSADNRESLYGGAIDGARNEQNRETSHALRTVKANLETLVETIRRLTSDGCTQNSVIVMLYFDEAHVLIHQQGSNRWNLLDALQSCLADMSTSHTFTLFLSTSPTLRDFAPPKDVASSARAAEDTNLQAPLTEVAFDCGPKLPVKPGLYKREELAQVELMAQFGRPLFWSMFQHKGYEDQGLMEFARIKLTGHSTRGKVPTHHEIIMLLDVRLMLDYESRHGTARSFQADLVAGNMRMNYSVPSSGEYLQSGYSSEPILAEVAARQLDLYTTSDRGAILDALTTSFRIGLLDKGEQGELIGRLLLTNAYDCAIRKVYTGWNTRCYSLGVKLIVFIQELFSEKYAREILDSRPDNVQSNVTFREAFKDAYVRFTHFGRMADDTGTTTNGAWAAFVRGMAILTRRGDNDVDAIIPVLMWDVETREEVTSGLLVQFKDRITAGTSDKYCVNQQAIRFFPPDCISVDESEQVDDQYVFDMDQPREKFGTVVRPYISLVMELGMQTPSLPGASIPTNVVRMRAKPYARNKIHVIQSLAKEKEPTKVPPTKRRKLDRRSSHAHIPTQDRTCHPADLHPRYNILAYGCSSTVYKVVGPEESDKLAQISAFEEFLSEHPRNHPDALEAVRKMKPFWSAGAPSYHWIDDELLVNDGGVDLQQEDWVYISSYDGSENEEYVQELGEETGKGSKDCVQMET